MILKSIKYSDNLSGWAIRGRGDAPLDLEQINLVVGQNATGKTRTLDIIRFIADLIAGRADASNTMRPEIGNYELLLQNRDNIFDYILNIKGQRVKQEILSVNGLEKLNRQIQILFYEKEDRNLSFKIRDNEIAVTKGDSEQQPFFDTLYQWGSKVSHYKFGGKMSRDNYDREDGSFTFRNETNVSSVFARGLEIHGKEEFHRIILDDMKKIEYNLKSIERSLNFTMSRIIVREVELNTYTDQHEMSQGMFRALSLIIQLNYSLLSNQPSLILIDDIGEGLDYERSKKLIDLIIKKIEGTQVQLIMTTNDRFVMNKVPLKYWQVIKREKNKSVFYNYENSKQTFDDFTLTGLSNFDFFATEFFVKGFDEYVKVNP